jgi:ParB-like chromosome segregation protein Spo0J
MIETRKDNRMPNAKETGKVAAALVRLAVPVAKLHEDPRNARKHDDRNLHAIKRSLAKFGQQKPIVALADGTVIAGNGTLRAAVALGWDKIAVVRFDGGDKTMARAYAIADNRSAELAEWDKKELQITLRSLEKEKINLDDLALSPEELAEIVGAPKQVEKIFSAGDDAAMPPESVQQNIDELNAIRKVGRTNVGSKNDTERYLVLVYPTRKEKGEALIALGLNPEERYVNGAKIHLGIAKAGVSAAVPGAPKAAPPNKSGQAG